MYLFSFYNQITKQHALVSMRLCKVKYADLIKKNCVKEFRINHLHGLYLDQL